MVSAINKTERVKEVLDIDKIPVFLDSIVISYNQLKDFHEEMHQVYVSEMPSDEKLEKYWNLLSNAGLVDESQLH